MTSPHRAVYTALMGAYEALVEQPVAHDSVVEFICFTDDPDLVSDTWTIRHVEPLFPLDPVRSARHLKTVGHPSLDEYDETLWIDNSLLLKVAPETILDEWLGDAEIAMPLHSYRRSVVAEFEEIIVTGRDDPGRVYEQLSHYTALDAGSLEKVPFWTAIIARRRTEEVSRFGSLWRDHVLRYSRRDQLSVRLVQGLTGIRIGERALDNRESPLHVWPVATGRSTTPAMFRVSDSLQPPIAQVGQLQRELDRVTLQLNQSVVEREKRVQELEALVANIFSSRSWRAMGFARAVRSRLGGPKAR